MNPMHNGAQVPGWCGVLVNDEPARRAASEGARDVTGPQSYTRWTRLWKASYGWLRGSASRATP